MHTGRKACLFEGCKNLSVKVPNADRYTLSVEQLDRLVQACDTEIQSVVVTLLADTGIRRSELASDLSELGSRGQMTHQFLPIEGYR